MEKKQKSGCAYGCMVFGIAALALVVLIFVLSNSAGKKTEIRPVEESTQTAFAHIYDNVEIITLKSGSGEAIGKCSIVKAASSDVTESALTDWYFNHVEPGGYNYAIIAYTDKQNVGVYGNKGIIEKDVGLHPDEDGSYSIGSDDNAIIYTAVDGKLVELTDN